VANDLSKASGILRQLLIDSSSLVDLANQNHRLRIAYKTNKIKKAAPKEVIQDGVKWETVIAVNFIEYKGDGEYFALLAKSKFLSSQVFLFRRA
jgi:hypothetical protein